MSYLKKTLLFTVLSCFSVTAAFSMNGTTTNAQQDTVLLPIEGNWPDMPPAAPFCYDLVAPEYEFGFGIRVNTAGLLYAGQPPLFATFTIVFNGHQPFVESIPITNNLLTVTGTFNGYTIYEYYAEYYENLSALCPANMEEASYIFQLTTDYGTGGTQYPYPVGNYAGPGQMFTKDVFSHNHFVENGTKTFCCGPLPPSFGLIIPNQGNSLETPVSNGDFQKVDPGFAENNAKENTDQLFQVYPNPFNEEFTVQLNAKEAEYVNIEIFDMQGKLVRQFQKDKPEGAYLYQVKTDDLIGGVYFVRTALGGEVYVEKVVKSD